MIVGLLRHAIGILITGLFKIFLCFWILANVIVKSIQGPVINIFSFVKNNVMLASNSTRWYLI